MNRPDGLDAGTAGPPMPGTEIRIVRGGEVQVQRSALTFSGYLDKPDATAEAFTPGGEWLRTGDLGEIVDDRRLRSTGRAKERIAPSAGRKIAPAPIGRAQRRPADLARALSWRGLQVSRRAAFPAPGGGGIVGRSQAIADPWPALAHRPALRLELQEAVDRVNDGLARTGQIKAFAVTDAEFTTESGELTPTLEPMRSVIASRCAEHFNRLHST
jgi:long-chain acyl-CoA synthetase